MRGRYAWLPRLGSGVGGGGDTYTMFSSEGIRPGCLVPRDGAAPLAATWGLWPDEPSEGDPRQRPLPLTPPATSLFPLAGTLP